MRGIKLFKEGLQIPFYNSGSREGNMAGYPDYATTSKPNYIFTDSLKYVGYSRGRSSIKAIFQNDKGNKFEMFMVDFDLMLKSIGLPKLVTGRWAFRKQGMNYGIFLIDENDK